jgi:hypothetical protein
MDQSILFQVISVAGISASLLTFTAGDFLLEIKKEYLNQVIIPFSIHHPVFRKVMKYTKIWIIIIFSVFVMAEILLLLFLLTNENIIFFRLSQVFFYSGILILGLQSYDLLKICAYL